MKLKFRIIVLFLIVTCFSCEKSIAPNEEIQKLSCDSMPSGFQCLSAAGQTTTTTYKVPEIIGYWNSDDFDFCVQYKSDGTGKITYKASGFSPGSTIPIKWGAMVTSTGDFYSSNGELRILHESTNGTPVDIQIALLTFLPNQEQFYGYDLVPVSSCGTANPGTGNNNGSGNRNGNGNGNEGTGNYTFWTSADYGCGPVTVTINGVSKVINSYFSESPNCNEEGAATFSLPQGSYTFTAECNNIKWGPSAITVINGTCFKMELTYSGK